MNAATNVFYVACVQLGDIKHFPSDTIDCEFWTRDITATAEDGSKFTLTVFTRRSPDNLRAEPQEAADAT
jgi:hypothetical protein